MRLRGPTLLALALLPALAACPKAQPRTPRHVVLLSIDTQRADRLSCYGHERKTPAIDALAAESMLFERCASQASWTLPSMTSLLTGRYVAEELMGIPADQPTLAEIFRKAGWTTGGFVCNDILNPDGGFERGFADYDWKLPTYGPNAPILDWLRAHKDERSFAWIHLNEVHDEGYAYRPQPEADWRKYRDLRPGFAPDRMQYYEELSRKLNLSEREASLERMQEEDGSYDDDVRYEDHRIGEILAELKQLGIWDDTLLVLCADHGEGLFTREQFYSGTRKAAIERGEPATLFNTLQMTHGSQVNYELIHVPLIVHAPGLPAGRVRGWVENVDIAPTLLELCGLRRAEHYQGESLLPLLRDPGDRGALKPVVFTHSRYNDSAIDQDSFQLIVASATGSCDFNLRSQLYDLPHDPEARHDLIGREPEREQVLSRLVARRLKEGLGGGVAGPIPSATLKAMMTLGYVQAGSGTGLEEALRAMTTAQLLELAHKSPGECMVRREIARMLEERKLSAEEKTAVQGWLAKEGSPAVRAILERILAAK